MFEFSQEGLEKYCEHLHGMVEKPLDTYLDPNIFDKSPFYRFKSDLVSYYTATTKFYSGMVKDYEWLFELISYVFFNQFHGI